MGAACIGYNENGKIEHEIYFINKKRHREDGPAEICYNESGKAWLKEYWLNSRLVSTGDYDEFTKALEEYRIEEIWG